MHSVGFHLLIHRGKLRTDCFVIMIYFLDKSCIFVLNTSKDIVPCLFESVGGNHSPISGERTVTDPHNIGNNVFCNSCARLVEIIHCHVKSVQLVAECDYLFKKGKKKRITEILSCKVVNSVRIKIKFSVEERIVYLCAEAD